MHLIRLGIKRQKPNCYFNKFVLKAREKEHINFYWQNGYGAFSIGKSQVNTLRKYIQNQEKHHIKKSFKEEFLEILNRCGVEYDERYLWN